MILSSWNSARTAGLAMTFLATVAAQPAQAQQETVSAAVIGVSVSRQPILPSRRRT